MSEPTNPVFSQDEFTHEEIILESGDIPGVNPLPVYFDPVSRLWFSRWKLSPKEIEYILRTGTVVVAIMCPFHPPINVHASKAGLMPDGGVGFYQHEDNQDPLERLGQL